MKKIREIATKWYFIIPLALAVLVVSCSKESAPTNVKNSSGEDIYKAVFFGKNTGASLANFSLNLAQYASNELERKAFDAFQSDIMEDIRAEDATFFDNFGKKIKKGSLAQIDQELKHAIGLTRKVVNKRIGRKVAALKPEFKRKFATEFIKDKGNKMSILEVRALLKKQKYHAMFQQAVAPEKRIMSDESASVDKNVSIEVNYYIYLEIAAMVVGFVMIAFIVDTEAYTSDGGGESMLTNNNNALFNQQKVVAIAETFSEL